RCAKLSTLNIRDIKILENLNPFAIIDFRDPKEVKMAPDNLSPKLLEKYINLPISASTLSRMVSEKELNGDEVKSYEKVMEESYRMYINNHKKVWIKFFEILLRSNKRPIIFHCSAGKDRTGIASFMIQSIFKNPIKLIFENYLISNDLLTIKAATAEQKTNSSKQDTLVTKNMLITLGKVKKSYLNAAIDEIEKNYSSLENYLISQLGLKHNDIQKIQQLFVSQVLMENQPRFL
ncbi:MAG: tyrosine-protein phosphatase, partial [Paracoccaceae bacterium]